MWQPLRPSCLRPTSSLRLTVFPNGQFQHHQSRATLRSRSPCASWAPPLHRGLVRGFFPAPHHHDPNEMLPNFAFWVVVVSHSGPTLEARGCADGLDRRRRAHGQDGEDGSSIGVMASIVEEKTLVPMHASPTMSVYVANVFASGAGILVRMQSRVANMLLRTCTACERP